MPQITIRPVLKSLHLVPAAKMHLADQAGPVAMIGKMGRPGEVLGKNDPMVGPGGAAMAFQPGQHRHSAGGTDRVGAGGMVKTDAAGSQPVQVGRLHQRIAGKAGHITMMFIGHD